MTFLNPLMLFGALASILPVIFHLIYKKKAKLHPFPAVRFLLKSKKSALFFSKLEEFFLLLIRIIIIIIISSAFARPVISTFNFTKHDDKSITVLIVDDSYSMNYEIGNGSAFALGKKVASKFMEVASMINRVFLFWTSDDVNGLKPDALYNKKFVLDNLVSREISYNQKDIVSTMRYAVEALSKEHSAVKRIILITDMQKSFWSFSNKEMIARLNDTMGSNSIDFFILNMTTPEDTKNITIENVALYHKALNNQTGIDIVIDVKNYSSNVINDLVLSIFLNDKKVAESFIKTGPNQKITKNIFLPLDGTKNIKGMVKLASKDFIKIDDVRHFSLSRVSGIKILVVDGDTRPYLFDNESFYIMKAFMSNRDNNVSTFDPVMITPDMLSTEDLNKYDVFVFCNVQEISDDIARSLKKQVYEKGKGVFFTMGNHVEPERYNSMFKDILPIKLRGVKTLKRNEYEKISGIELEHPILNIFNLPESGDFSNGTIKKYFLSRQYRSEGSQYLLTFSKGAPFLIIGDKGKGKTALITSTVDREWNDLSIQTTFLPLMHQIMLHLSNNLERFKGDIIVGDSKSIKMRHKGQKITVTLPNGKQSGVEVYSKGTGSIGKFKKTNQPGIYKIGYEKSNKKIKKGLSEEYFAVNIDTKIESDLTKIDSDGLKELFGDNRFKIIPFEPGMDIVYTINKNTITGQMWPFIMLAVLILIFLESLLSSRLGRGNT